MRRENFITGRIASLMTLTLVLATTGVLCAQNIVTGDLTGTITDPSDAVVAGATITLTNLATGTTQSTASN